MINYLNRLEVYEQMLKMLKKGRFDIVETETSLRNLIEAENRVIEEFEKEMRKRYGHIVSAVEEDVKF